MNDLPKMDEGVHRSRLRVRRSEVTEGTSGSVCLSGVP